MATFVELKNLVDLTLLQTFKTQQDAAVQKLLDEKEALGTAAGLVGALSSLKTTEKGTVVAAINEVRDAAVTAQNTADGAVTKIGTLPEGSATVVDLVDAKVSAINTSADALAARVTQAEADIDAIEADYLKAADKEALQTQITSNKNAIDTLNGSGDGSVDAKITAAFNEFSTKVSDDNVVNTYKELIDYAAAHGAEFTELVGKVTANENAISALSDKVGSIPDSSSQSTVTGYVAELVGNETTRAKLVEEQLTEDVEKLQAQVGEGGTVADSIATAKSEAITAAKTYTDEEVAKDRARITTAEEDIDALEDSLAEGGATKTAIDNAQSTADAAKAKAEANETAATALAARVKALEDWASAITLATESDVLAMFTA